MGVDVAQRDQILAHAELIQQAMDASQEQDPARWFEDQERKTRTSRPAGASAPASATTGASSWTRGGDACLQTATIAAARPGFDLKPFFCTAFPITITAGTLWMDELCLEGPARCCRPADDGAAGRLDVCEAELRHVLGSEGLGELRRLAAEHGPGRRALEDPLGMGR